MQLETADFAPDAAVLRTRPHNIVTRLTSDWCRHLVNLTKHTRRLQFCPFALLCENMTSSTRPLWGESGGAKEPLLGGVTVLQGEGKCLGLSAH